MKKLLSGFIPVITIALGLACVGSTCQRRVARTVLDVMECLLVHEEIEDPKALAATCSAEDLLPEVEKYLGAKKAAQKQRARMAASASASGSAK